MGRGSFNSYLFKESLSLQSIEYPYETWHGVKPKVNNLRVFGCDAYAQIPKDERGKFDSKRRKCILVGYGRVTKGYRLYDITEEKVYFDEEIKMMGVILVTCVTDSHYRLIVDHSSHSDMESDNEATQPHIRPRSTKTKERT